MSNDVACCASDVKDGNTVVFVQQASSLRGFFKLKKGYLCNFSLERILGAIPLVDPFRQIIYRLPRFIGPYFDYL